MKLNKSTKTIILTIILVIFVIGVVMYRNKIDQFEQSEKEILADKISAFMKPETTYKEYIDFLIINNNKSYKLLEQEVFYEFKTFKKTRGLLLPEDILKHITDM